MGFFKQNPGIYVYISQHIYRVDLNHALQQAWHIGCFKIMHKRNNSISTIKNFLSLLLLLLLLLSLFYHCYHYYYHYWTWFLIVFNFAITRSLLCMYIYIWQEYDSFEQCCFQFHCIYFCFKSKGNAIPFNCIDTVLSLSLHGIILPI